MLKVWEWRVRPWSPSIKTLRAVGAVRPTTLIFIKILIKLSGTLTDTVLTTHTAHRRNLEQTLRGEKFCFILYRENKLHRGLDRDWLTC